VSGHYVQYKIAALPNRCFISVWKKALVSSSPPIVHIRCSATLVDLFAPVSFAHIHSSIRTPRLQEVSETIGKVVGDTVLKWVAGSFSSGQATAWPYSYRTTAFRLV
jgi:hypothetical protein